MQNIINIKRNSIALGVLILMTVFYGAMFFGIDQASAAYCPFSPAANRTIVNFNASIIWGRGTDRTMATKYVNLPAGEYRVNLSASDGYEGREDKSQPNESYYIELRNGSTVVAQSGMTPDLADRTRYAQWGGAVSTLTIDSSIDSIVAKHSNYRRAGGANDSLDLGCAAFDRISTPTPDLSATCSVSPSSVNVGSSVNWSVSATGGNNSYNYSWTGDESLSGNSSSVSKSYTTAGTKLGIVTVTSGSQSVTRTCSVAVTQQTSNLTGSCSASPSAVAVGGTINWSASASGGTGSYTYLWSGSDNLSGNNSSVSKSYSVAGAKNASVLVTSGSQSQTFYCNANVTDTPPPSGDLNVSCDVDDSRVEVDEDVRFTANATGGNGSYTYTWTGSEGLFSTNRSFEWSFDNDGTKRATVVVMSNGQSASDTCSVRVEDEEEDEDLRVSCYANPSNVQVGQQMRWYADVRGGDGDYDYDWDGDDGLNSSSYSPSMTYNTGGRKDATLRVRSDGQTETADCSVNVNQNQVLAFSQTDVPLQGAVYLSEVPYTGLADNLKLFWFLLGLAMFSAYAAYVVIAYKKNVGEFN